MGGFVQLGGGEMGRDGGGGMRLHELFLARIALRLPATQKRESERSPAEMLGSKSS